MTRVPVITSPCPLRWNAAPQPGKDFCGQCQRRVYNLDTLSDAQRVAFLSGCDTKVCVFYTVRRPRAAAAALGFGLAAAGTLAAGTAPAQEAPAENPVAGEYCDPFEDILEVGGIVADDSLQWVDEAEAQAPTRPDLPQIDASEWLPTPDDAVAGKSHAF
jgi:hypothetical protein